MKKTRLIFDNSVIEVLTEENIFDTIRKYANAEYEDLDTYSCVHVIDTQIDNVEVAENYIYLYIVVSDKKEHIIRNKSIRIDKDNNYIKVILKNF